MSQRIHQKGMKFSEEAIGSEKPRVASEDVVIDQVDDVVKVGRLEGSLEFDSNVGNEVEKFEEAIEVPVAGGNLERELPVSVEDKGDSVGNGDLVGEAAEKEVINEESQVEKVVKYDSIKWRLTLLLRVTEEL